MDRHSSMSTAQTGIARWLLVVLVLACACAAVVAVVLVRRAPQGHVSLAAPPAPQAETYVCPMHPDVRQSTPGRCPICGMALEKQTPDQSAGAHTEAHGARAVAENPARPAVQPGPEAAAALEPRGSLTLDGRRQQLIGVRTVAVSEDVLTRGTRTAGIVRFDESRWTDVNVRAEGWIRRLYVDRTGDTVRRGQPLLALYSPELATAQAEYVLALRNREAATTRAAHAGDALAGQQADRLVAAARQRLARWDLPASHVAELERQKEVPPVITFPSPVSGVVMEKRAVEGMRVMPGESLYRIVDTSEVWVEADVYEADLAALRVGQTARVHLQALPGEAFAGRVSWIAPTLDEASRTGKARIQLPNRGGRLKPGMFAEVELDSALPRSAVVPADALLDTGQQQFVFVTDGAGFFEPRRVRAGQRVDGRVQVLEGVKPGEQVAASATFFIDSESQIRAALEGYQAPPSAGRQPPPGEALRIALRSEPDPPRAGLTRFEVDVKTPQGDAVTDATVTLVLFMPAMPSMNMPAMRSDATLGHAGNGIYRGSIDVMMNGRWDATVTVSRGADRLGARQFPILAK